MKRKRRILTDAERIAAFFESCRTRVESLAAMEAEKAGIAKRIEAEAGAEAAYIAELEAKIAAEAKRKELNEASKEQPK